MYGLMVDGTTGAVIMFIAGDIGQHQDRIITTSQVAGTAEATDGIGTEVAGIAGKCQALPEILPA